MSPKNARLFHLESDRRKAFDAFATVGTLGPSFGDRKGSSSGAIAMPLAELYHEKLFGHDLNFSDQPSKLMSGSGRV